MTATPPYSLVLPVEAQESYWQPAPSHGYMTTILTPENCPSNIMAAAVQSIDQGCQIRPHAHTNMDEVLLILEGRGTLLVDGRPTSVGPGDSTFLGRFVRHELFNDGDGPLKLLAILLPPGTEYAWRTIGRRRLIGEPAPPRFGRDSVADLDTVLKAAGFAAPSDIDAPPARRQGGRVGLACVRRRILLATQADRRVHDGEVFSRQYAAQSCIGWNAVHSPRRRAPCTPRQGLRRNPIRDQGFRRREARWRSSRLGP